MSREERDKWNDDDVKSGWGSGIVVVLFFKSAGQLGTQSRTCAVEDEK